jgi:hypothetical protein
MDAAGTWKFYPAVIAQEIEEMWAAAGDATRRAIGFFGFRLFRSNELVSTPGRRIVNVMKSPPKQSTMKNDQCFFNLIRCYPEPAPFRLPSRPGRS